MTASEIPPKPHCWHPYEPNFVGGDGGEGAAHTAKWILYNDLEAVVKQIAASSKTFSFSNSERPTPVELPVHGASKTTRFLQGVRLRPSDMRAYYSVGRCLGRIFYVIMLGL